jgi:hypothetical protein
MPNGWTVALAAPERLKIGFRVQGSGFRVQGSGCRVQGAGMPNAWKLRARSTCHAVELGGFVDQSSGVMGKGVEAPASRCPVVEPSVRAAPAVCFRIQGCGLEIRGYGLGCRGPSCPILNGWTVRARSTCDAVER